MYDLTSIKISRSRRPDFLLDGGFFVWNCANEGYKWPEKCDTMGLLVAYSKFVTAN